MSRGSKPGREANGYKHGMIDSPEYNSWKGMSQRCFNPKNPAYPDYGGRGIVVCDRWKSFRNFLEDMGNAPGPEYSVDRYPNTNGNYEPNNCRWATREEQNNNTRRNVFYEHEGETITHSQLARKIGIKKTTLTHRLNNGMSFEQATTQPLKVERTYTHEGQTKTLREWADHLGMGYNTLYQRVAQKGWTIADALARPERKAKTFLYDGKECTVREISEATGIEYKTLHARLINYGWSVDRAVSEKIREY